MATRKRKQRDMFEGTQEGPVKVKGTYRLQIEQDGKIISDSGWHTNLITNLGFQDYLCALLGNTTGSKQVGYMALGSGTIPGATDTTLNGEVVATTRRPAVGVSINASKTVSFLATFNSTASFVTTSYNISNIGLFNVSTTGQAELFAGNTFAASSLATNQNVNATYSISFS